jgi:hypothetical protein
MYRPQKPIRVKPRNTEQRLALPNPELNPFNPGFGGNTVHNRKYLLAILHQLMPDPTVSKSLFADCFLPLPPQLDEVTPKRVVFSPETNEAAGRQSALKQRGFNLLTIMFLR